MSNDTKNVDKEQKEIQAKASYESSQADAHEELLNEEQNLNSKKTALGYGDKSWQEIANITIEDLTQAEASQVIELQDFYKEYLKHEQKFKNTVYIVPSKLHEVVDAAEKLLLTQHDHIYKRSGKLVRVTQVSNSPDNKKRLINRAPDTIVIKEIDQAYLTIYLTKVGHFVAFDARSGCLKKIDCPEKIARYLLSKQEWDVPVLVGVINAPTLRVDGSILDTPGYDPISGLLFFPGDCEFKKIPENPTHQDAVNAKDVLLKLLEDFPFEDEASKSVALAAILTVLIRKSLLTAPLFGFTAPKMASGKSLLADVVALISTGKSNSVISQAENETEEKKRIMSVLIEGDAIVCFDNVEKPFKSAALCSILTQAEYKDRLLGGNETRTVLTNTTFLVTGNNLVFLGDISTRSLLCKLDPQVERPEERSFTLNLRKYIPQHRAKLVTAALTILRAYHVAGRPPQDIKQFGRFDDWSDWIRSALVWCKMTDPCESRKDIEESDPIRMQLNELFTAWHAFFGNREIKVQELIATKTTSPEESESNLEAYHALQEILKELAADNKGIINPRSLAKQLSRYKNRIEGGFRLEQGEKHQGTSRWRVTEIKI
ncbi:MAG: hypothetical protein WC747_04845 [Candidatus Babeliales bacterium]|jgi:hypothetical protein